VYPPDYLYYIWGAIDMLEEKNKLQPKLKMTVELKVALQTIWEELPQEHVNNTVANFTCRRLTAILNGGYLQ